MKAYLTIFLTVFLAEVGDKTQLATMLFAADRDHSPLGVFAAAASALVVAAALAVIAGAALDRFAATAPLKLLAGLGFIAIGGYMVFEHFRGA